MANTRPPRASRSATDDPPPLPERTPLGAYFDENPEETLLTVSQRSSGYDGVALDPAMLSKYRNAAEHLRRATKDATVPFWLPEQLTQERIAHATGGKVKPEAWLPFKAYADRLRRERRRARRSA